MHIGGKSGILKRVSASTSPTGSRAVRPSWTFCENRPTSPGGPRRQTRHGRNAGIHARGGFSWNGHFWPHSNLGTELARRRKGLRYGALSGARGGVHRTDLRPASRYRPLCGGHHGGVTGGSKDGKVFSLCVILGRPESLDLPANRPENRFCRLLAWHTAEARQRWNRFSSRSANGFGPCELTAQLGATSPTAGRVGQPAYDQPGNRRSRFITTLCGATRVRAPISAP